MLDPRGSHGQGATFLKCFLAALDLKEPFDANSATVDPEFGIGPRTETDGGRLDLLIRDENRRKIAIENKIYAEEQENWVRRYRSWLGKDASLIYLTLFGGTPVQIDQGEEKSVHCISYATTIIKWLEACRKEVSTVPIVRESLTQYIHLIQKLTHQNTSSRMNEEIIKSVLDNEENFKGYRALRDADQAIKRKIIQNLSERVRERVPAAFEVVGTPKGNFEKYEEFAFSTPELTARNLRAGIAFDKHSYRDCLYGFQWINNQRLGADSSVVQEVLRRHFKEKFGDYVATDDLNWPAWQWWKDWKEWDDDDLQIIEFSVDRRFDERILRRVEELHEVASSFAKEMSQSIERESVNRIRGQ